MRTLAEVEQYLKQLQQDQGSIADRENSPEATVVGNALEILAHVSTPQQLIAELQSKRNLTSHKDEDYLQTVKRWYNRMIDYIQEKDTMAQDNWETQEVINHLINDPSECLFEIAGMSPRELETWVKQGNAPNGLYQSFNRPPVSSFNVVDWNAVYEAVNGE